MADVAVPHGSYRSFDAFFTRTLRAGARSISDQPVVSPCDGRLTAQGPIDEGARLFVKGQPYEVGTLLGHAGAARRFVGGSFVVIYLSPRDYHRVHAPVDGNIVDVRGVPGDCYPVNSIGEQCVSRLLVGNRRVVVSIETADQQGVAVVMVGALIVGKITVNLLGDDDVSAGEHPVSPALPVSRGDEIGAFHLGSTVVLLAQAGISLRCVEGPIVLGEPLSRTGS